MKQKKKTDNKPKTKGLFDHVKHIREVQDPNYLKTLTESELEDFSKCKFIILRTLSMDSSLIEEIAFISQYFEELPDEQFYKLLIGIIPKSNRFCPYIKSKLQPVNKTILNCICNTFNIGSKDAIDYYNILISNENGLGQLTSILQNFGYNEKEIESLFE